MKNIKFALVLCLFLAACDDTKGSKTLVGKGDPTNRRTKKEKVGTIVTRFKALDMELHCPTNCQTDYIESLQNMYYYFDFFQKRRGRIHDITLDDSDSRFDAKGRAMIFPKVTTEQHITEMFATLSFVEAVEQMLRMRIGFPADAFHGHILQKALDTLRKNVSILRPYANRIQWIEVDTDNFGCANKTWTVSRDSLENHFGEAFDNLKKCVGGHATDE